MAEKFFGYRAEFEQSKDVRAEKAIFTSRQKRPFYEQNLFKPEYPGVWASCGGSLRQIRLLLCRFFNLRTKQSGLVIAYDN